MTERTDLHAGLREASHHMKPEAPSLDAAIQPLRPASAPPPRSGPAPGEGSRSPEPLPWKGASRWSVFALLAGDVASLWLARELVLALRVSLFGPHGMVPAFPEASLLWLTMRLFYGLYPGYGVSQPEELRRSAITTVLAALSHSSLLVALKDAEGSRFIALGVWVLLIPIAWLLRDVIKHLLLRWNLYGRPVVVLGAGKSGRHTIREILDTPALGIVPVAAFDDDPAKLGTSVEGVPVIGTLRDAASWRASYPVGDAIIAMPSAGAPRVVSIAHGLSHRYRNVGVIADLVGVGTLWTRTKNIGTCSMLEMPNQRFERSNLLWKRAFDLVVAVPLLVITGPVIALCALLVKVLSPGAPVFFSQSREGAGGRRVRMWKIRTMLPDADRALDEYLDANTGAREHWDRHMKLKDDPRILPWLGVFLRRSSLDEFPQLWNVLKGDMSLVGPRPFPDYHLERFPREFRELRRQVPPGITGYWQVIHRSASSIEQQQASDTYYIYNWSLWLDLWIIFRTVGAVLSGKGAY